MKTDIQIAQETKMELLKMLLQSLISRKMNWTFTASIRQNFQTSSGNG